MQAERRVWVEFPIASLNANHYHLMSKSNCQQKPMVMSSSEGTTWLVARYEGFPMERNGHTLASLKRGQKGTIKSVDASDPQVQRLMTLGLVEGAEVELAGRALGGDPIEFRLFGCGISLREEQAERFTVTTADAGG